MLPLRLWINSLTCGECVSENLVMLSGQDHRLKSLQLNLDLRRAP